MAFNFKNINVVQNIMNITKIYILFFQIGLISLILIISYFAFTPLDHSIVKAPGIDKINHLLAFSVLALFCDLSFPKKSFVYFTALPLLVYAFFIEIVQYFLPFRTFSMFDIFADIFGLWIYFQVVRKYLLKWQ
jgi:VanZ family protein